MDYAFHLTRRPRGLPLWFSLAVHGSDAYGAAIEAVLSTVAAAARDVQSRPYLELVMDPDLSVLLIRRLKWSRSDYENWCQRLLREEIAFVIPTDFKGETVIRICIINPLTNANLISLILDSMR